MVSAATHRKFRKQVETIERLSTTGTQNLRKLVGDAKETLLALKVELRDDEEERASPIALTLPANDPEISPGTPNRLLGGLG